MSYPRGAGPHAGHFTSIGTGQAPASTRLPRVEYRRATFVTGVGLVSTFGPVPDSHAWLIQRMAVWCSTTTVADVYIGPKDSYGEEYRASSTPAGARDEYDAASYIPAAANQYVSIVWPSATAAASAGARIEYWEI